MAVPETGQATSWQDVTRALLSWLPLALPTSALVSFSLCRPFGLFRLSLDRPATGTIAVVAGNCADTCGWLHLNAAACYPCTPVC